VVVVAAVWPDPLAVVAAVVLPDPLAVVLPAPPAAVAEVLTDPPAVAVVLPDRPAVVVVFLDRPAVDSTPPGRVFRRLLLSSPTPGLPSCRR